MPATPATPLSTFVVAQANFLASLPAKERVDFPQCQSSKHLIQEIETLDQFSEDKNGRRLRHALQKVKGFTDRVQPYFDSIGIVVQSHPEVAGIIWGAMRFSLQLASNYVTFFEKLGSTLSALANKLPQLESIIEIFRQGEREPSRELVFSLQQIYIEVFHLFKRLADIFKGKNGKPRAKPLVAASLALTPFDVRFKDLLQRLESHDQIIRHEIEIVELELSIQQRREQITMQNVLDISCRDSELRLKSIQDEFDAFRSNIGEQTKILKENSEQLTEELKEEMIDLLKGHKINSDRYSRERRVAQIRDWIDPSEFRNIFEELNSVREPGTAHWLFRENLFRTWRASEIETSPFRSKFSKQCLWITGDPGNGKSVLAAASVEELGSSGACCLYYFFSDIPGTEKRTAAYRALLSQILHLHKSSTEILDIFDVTMFESTVGQKIASTTELTDLLGLCLRALDNCYLVLDGIDECADRNALILEICQMLSLCSTKVLFFSRPNVIPPANFLTSDRRFCIDDRTGPDIRHYATHHLTLMQRDDLLPAEAKVATLAEHLTIGADGMFLCVKLMVDYLRLGVFTPPRRVKDILSITMPEKLDKVYNRILTQITTSHPAEQKLARWVFAWLAYAERQVTAVELRESSRLIELQTEEETNGDDQFEQSVIVSCACLVKKVKKDNPPVFRFVHLTAKRFVLHSTKQANANIIPTMAMSHLLIARGCLQYLYSCLPGRPLSGAYGVDVCILDLEKRYPLCRYVSTCWIHHLLSATSGIYNEAIHKSPLVGDLYLDLAAALSQFLCSPGHIMSWIEAHHTFGASVNCNRLREASGIASKCIDLLPQSAHQDSFGHMNELAEDVQKLQQQWSNHLSTSPSCIWVEGAAYCDSEFFVKDVMRVDTLSPRSPLPSTLSPVPLQTAHETSTDGLRVGVLSIWPSRDYHRLASSTDHSLAWTKDISSTLHQHSTGWAIRYQIYTIADKPEIILDIHRSLEQRKVWRQLRHSLWKKGAGTAANTCRLQFPTSISKCLHRLAILEDIYSVELSSEGQPSIRVRTLPLTFNDTVMRVWSTDFNESDPEMIAENSNIFTFDSWIHQYCELYLYWIRFSDDGKYVFFLDKPPSEPNNLAVFELSCIADDSAPRLVDFQMKSLYGGNKQVFSDAAVFHPHRSLIMFTLVNSVWLWAYGCDEPHLESIYYTFDVFKAVTFSSCGNFAVVHPHAETYPIIKPIPDTIRKIMDKSEAEKMNTDHQKHKDLVISTAFSSLSGFDLIPQAVVDGSQVQVRKDGSTQGLSTSWSKSNSIQMHLWNGRKRAHCELSKLPNMDGFANPSTTLLPQCREERIRMILDQAKKPWSDLSETGKYNHLPALVTRDHRSLNYVQESTKQDSRLIERIEGNWNRNDKKTRSV